VIHVLPYDLPRGAQRHARELVDRLADGPDRHVVLTLFTGESNVLRADIALDVPRGRWRAWGFDPRAFLALRRQLRETVPDVVVSHGGESAKYVTLAHSPETLHIYLNIGSVHPDLGRRVSSAIYRLYTRRADAVVAVSGALAEEARAIHGIDPERIVVIPNGRDPDVYGRDAREASPEPRLIWVGQLDRTKRPEWFVRMAERLDDDGVRFQALMVGDGPRRGEVEVMARDTAIAVLGRRDDVPELLGGCDILVFTGMPPEGMPGVLIEAGLSGLGTVSTRVPGADEVIDEGVTGLLVDVDDEPGLNDAVRQLIEDVDLRRKMGESARRRCIRLFSIDVVADEWRSLIGRLLAGGNRALR
jgi:glycosyltransferase involved in cell wall biosynthesis